MLALLAGALRAAPRPADASNIAALITKGYQRDVKSCQKKWKAILAQCKQASDPTLKNNCGLPRPTTTTSTSTTTTEPPPTCPGPTVVTTTTTSTTVQGCDSIISWAACGPEGKGCTCHRLSASKGLGDYVCASVGDQFNPSYLCGFEGCTSDQDCVDCSDDPAAICIGGASHEPPRGACVSKCP